MITVPKYFLKFLVVQVFLLSPVSAGAETKAVSPALIKAVLEIPVSLNSVMFDVALSGASNETVREIAENLKPHSEQLAKLRLTLNKNEIYVNGEKSGLRVSSYQPFNLEFKGRTWALDRKLSADQNFQSMIKFFNGSRTASLISIFIPEVSAYQGSRWATTAFSSSVGALIGAIVTVAVVSNPAGWVVAGAAAVGAGVLGTLAHGADEFKKAEAAEKTIVDLILNSKFTVSCTERRAEMSFSGPNGKFTVASYFQKVAFNKFAKERTLHFYHNSHSVYPTMTDEQKQILGNLNQCRTQADADKMAATVREAAQMANNVNGASVPHTSVTPDSKSME
jgi:hypothetical protein